MRIVFWGTPEFAATVLRAMLTAGADVAGVVTQPDRPRGRGRRVRPPPVKTTADEAGIPILQPEKPRGPEFVKRLRDLSPDVSVVAAYGHILRTEVLDVPPLGSFNVHASLLPELRGAAPVNWAIIQGLETTGVTIMRMVEQLDAGPILLQQRLEIPPRCSAGELTALLAELGGETLLEALALLERGQATEEPQDDDAATYAPKLDAEDACVSWDQPAAEIDRWIRGTDPNPGAWTRLDDLRVGLFAPEIVDPNAREATPGTVLEADGRVGLRVACGEGVLAVGEVHPAGKRRMRAVEWIRGRGIEAGRRLV